MSTEQNYVGRGTNATFTEQTAKQATPTALIAKLQEERREAIDKLFTTTNSFFGVDSQLKKATDAITEMLECWLLTEYKKEARECDDADFRYMESKLMAALDTIRFLTALSTDIDHIWYADDKLTVAKKEVSRDV